MDYIGILVSFIYLFLIIYISSLLSKGHSELSRKVIHIGVSNWWIIIIIFFNNVILASIVPAIFCIINYLSYKFDILKSMERDENKTLGTVYYAISCLLLTILTFTGFNNKLYAGIGILTMGYGDGLAALIGRKFTSREFKVFGNKKSVLGSFTMFLTSLIVITIITLCFNQFNILKVLLLSSVATIIEAISPFGIDNLTVPILTSLLAFLII